MNIAFSPSGSVLSTKFFNAFHQTGTVFRFSFFPFSKLFLMLNLRSDLLFATPIRQTIALMIKDVVHPRKTTHLSFFISIVDPVHRSCTILIPVHFHPDFGLCNPEIVTLHDLGGILTILNRFAHLRNSARQQTGIKSRLGNRKHPVPFSPELIPGLKLIPHLPGIRKIKKIALLCACIAGRLCWGTQHQESQHNGI